MITGSSRGIGKSIAKHSASHGANVIISSRSNEDCTKTAMEINEYVGSEKAFVITCDISKDEDLKNLVNATLQKFNKIDTLICNAASNSFMGSMLDIPMEDFDKIMHNNIRSNQSIKFNLPHMIDNGGGSIIIISSIASIKGSPIIGANISKAADVMIVKNIATEFGHRNIRAML